jgi:hypothetical protein
MVLRIRVILSSKASVWAATAREQRRYRRPSDLESSQETVYRDREGNWGEKLHLALATASAGREWSITHAC